VLPNFVLTLISHGPTPKHLENNHGLILESCQLSDILHPAHVISVRLSRTGGIDDLSPSHVGRLPRAFLWRAYRHQLEQFYVIELLPETWEREGMRCLPPASRKRFFPTYCIIDGNLMTRIMEAIGNL
jgi:hypothetical protein